MKNELATSTAELKASGERFTRDLAAVATEAGGALKELGDEKVQQARAAMDDARTSLGAQYESATAATGKYIQQRPLLALTAAGAIGLVLGLLLARS